MFRELRPELSDKTIRLYNRELSHMMKEFDTEDVLSLLEKMNSITVKFNDLKHIYLGSNSYNTSNIRLAVYRNLLDLFKDEVKNYDKIDTIILTERVSR